MDQSYPPRVYDVTRDDEDDGYVPEGDTVFALARRLDSAMRGRVLTHGELRVPAHATADLADRTVLEHVTYGKHLLTRLSGDLTLHTHLRMQGSWTVSKEGKWLPRSVMPDVRVVLRTDGPAAYGVRLPVVELLRTGDEDQAVGYLGPDPLRTDWDAAEAARRLAADPGRALVAALLDQRCVAGFGNLWVNELCFLRGHYPWTPVADVDLDALLRLGARALTHSATVPGAMQVTTGNKRKGEQHWVAGRAGRPCLRCGTTILVVDEVPNDPERRRTWWCPHCQPEPTNPTGP
ncbi:Fpg/Nei family DNA glycosylase [Williamsia maris]